MQRCLSFTCYGSTHLVCNVTFVNWVYAYPTTVFRDMGIQLRNYEENKEWILTNTSTQARVRPVDDDETIYIPEIGFTLYLKRRPMYYISNILIPCFMVALISCLVFLLPSDSGEKISLAITVTLAYTVLLLMVSDITPKSGTTTPHITVFLVISMGQTTVCLLVTVLILNIYHHNPNKPVPQCMQAVMFGCMARVLCMHAEAAGWACCTKVRPSELTKKNKNISSLQPLRVEDLDVSKVASFGQDVRGLPDDVIEYVRYLKIKNAEQEVEEKNKAEWMALGKVADRLFFIIFLISTVLEVAAFMGTVTSQGY